MAIILPFERLGTPAGQRDSLGASLLALAELCGLYSGLYLHFGHSQGSVARAIASTPVALRQYVDPIAGSTLVERALGAHRPFVWSGQEIGIGRSGETDPVGIAIPVQDYSNGPGLVTLIGVGIEAARVLLVDRGPSLSWAATDIHVAALDVLRCARTDAPSCREMECLRLVAAGLTVARIAGTLGIATRTVEVHLHKVVGKMGAANKVNAVAIAVSRGLLRCDPTGRERLEPAA